MTQTHTQIDRQRLLDILGSAQGKQILVLGDVMLDRYLWGNVQRISPEAPVPVVEVEEENVRLGGAANVAQNVKSLGAVPQLVSVVGKDQTGHLLRRELEAALIPLAGLIEVGDRVTTQKTRIVAKGQHVVRADQEDRHELTDSAAMDVADRVVEKLPTVKALIISDYGKGVVTRTMLERVLHQAAIHGVPVCVDPKDTHFYSYKGVAVITPNQFEAAEVLGYKLRDEETITRAGEELLGRLQSECVLITRGEHGMSLFERGAGRLDLPVVAQHVYDVTGAGDTVVSGFAVGLAGGAVPREAALIATHAAGLVVSDVGTTVPDLKALQNSFLGGVG